MGDADRPCRTRPRTVEPGLPGRDLRPARPGRGGTARGHAARHRRGRRGRPLPRGARPSRRPGPRRIAPPARRRRAADRAGRRQRVGRSGLCRHRPVPRGQRPAGLLLVPPPGHRRQPAAELSGRSRHRRRTDPRRAGQGGRPRACDRRPDRRDHLAILFAARHPRPRQGADPRPPGGRGIGPRLSSDPGDPVGHAGDRRRARRARPDREPALGRVAQGSARRIRGRTPGPTGSPTPRRWISAR